MSKLPTGKSTSSEVDRFLHKVESMPQLRPATGRGRLMFALDATASRQPTWDRASHLQAGMFEAAADLGGLEMQICFYRGYGEFKSTRWTADSAALLKSMTAVTCLGGQTQIERVLRHALTQTVERRINALVFVGDAMEEDIDRLCHLAGQLGVQGVPVFVFHEGGDPVAGNAFRQVARLSGGAYCPFDAGSAAQLKELLGAVAVYAAGGRKALVDYGRNRGEAVRLLTRQVAGN